MSGAVFQQKGLGHCPAWGVLPVNAGLTFSGVGEVMCPFSDGCREEENSRSLHFLLEIRLMVGQRGGRPSGCAVPWRSEEGGAYAASAGPCPARLSRGG